MIQLEQNVGCELPDPTFTTVVTIYYKMGTEAKHMFFSLANFQNYKT